jgi:TetR/AcrR family transcriptional regulator, cholesterol catabolism regulator
VNEPAASAPPPARRQRRREEVLETAARLFLEQGYAATSTTDIARELGLRRGSVYYYLDTKEELLYELIQRRFSSGIELLARLEMVEGDELDRLRWLIEQHICAVAENLTPSALALNESRSLSPEHRAAIVAENDMYRAGVTALVAAGQRSGSIRHDVDPTLLTMAILGAANWIHRWYDPAGGATPEDVGRQYAAVFTRGLAPEPDVSALLDRIEQQARRIAELERQTGAGR